MNPIGFSPLETTTAQLNGHEVSVMQVHRRWTAAGWEPGIAEAPEYEPVAVTVTAPFRLSLEDVAVVLFDLGIGDGEELSDDGYVRVLVAETVVNAGSLRIEELRCQLGEPILDPEQAAYLAYCRERATAVFGPNAAAPVPGGPGADRGALMVTAFKAARVTAAVCTTDPA